MITFEPTFWPRQELLSTSCCKVCPEELNVLGFFVKTVSLYDSANLHCIKCCVCFSTTPCEPVCIYLFWQSLDYCNSVLFGLPASTLAPLQRVQNAATRLVLRLDHRAHIKPAVQRLHWLPVKARIQFKIATVMHATLNQRGPAYLNNIIKFNTEESGRRQLRSSTTNASVVMRARTQFTGSAPSPSAVQVSGIRFLLTSGTFILSRLFAKL